MATVSEPQAGPPAGGRPEEVFENEHQPGGADSRESRQRVQATGRPIAARDFRARVARLRRQIADLRKYYRDEPVTNPAVAVDLVRLLAAAGFAHDALQHPIESMSEDIAWAMLNDPTARAELEAAWDGTPAEEREP